MTNGTVLITGASGGIGRELANFFAKDGYNVVLVARNEKKLASVKEEMKKMYSIHVVTLTSDLSNQNAVLEVFEELQRQQIEIDYLVNNAGFGLFGEFISTVVSQELNMIDLNVKTLTHFTKLFLPGMVKRNKGGILNIASTAAFQPGPLMAVYYATKAYVLYFSEALENELKDTNVTVTALCPGPTKTGFSDRANLHESKLFKSGVMNVKDVAAIGYKGFRQGKTIVIPGFKNRMLATIVRFFPRRVVTSLVRQTQDRDQHYK